MHFVAPLISNLRLSRFHRWAMLWLSWFAGFLEEAAGFGPLSAEAKAIAHRWLDQIEWLVVGIVLIRASYRVRRLPRRRGSIAPMRAGSRRAFLGAALGKQLRRRDLRQRIAALRQDIAVLVARILKRLPCGLTRWGAILAKPETAAAPLCAGVTLARGADTS